MSSKADQAIRELMTLTGATSVRQALGTVAYWRAALVQFRQQSVWLAVGNNGGYVARCPGGLGLGTYGDPEDPTAYRWLIDWEQWVVFGCPGQAMRAALAVPWLAQESGGQHQDVSAKATAAVRAQGEAGAARKDRPTPWVPGWAEEAF